MPGLQLVLAGSMALDDPEGWRIYREITAEASSDPEIHILTNLTGVGNVEINALQRQSDVVVQKSLREGFGLVVSEPLWKGTPVVAGRAGGITLQMADGVRGELVDGVEECAASIEALLLDRQRGHELGEPGRQRVREHFLIPRLVLNELSLMASLANGSPTPLTAGGTSAAAIRCAAWRSQIQMHSWWSRPATATCSARKRAGTLPLRSRASSPPHAPAESRIGPRRRPGSPNRRLAFTPFSQPAPILVMNAEEL